MGRRTHGMSSTPEYFAWAAMLSRCHNPANPRYDDYGGRGITVCDRWRADFAAFLADVGRRPSPAHSLDRIDNDRGYEPGNCRWATAYVQARNRGRRALGRSGHYLSTRWASHAEPTDQRNAAAQH
jgi:hypothetical protein